MVADLFHYGHVNFLRAAREQGDFLKVGIHSDEVARNYKRIPILSMEERIAAVAGCRYVDEVIGDAPLSVSREWIELHDIDLVVHGDDFNDELYQLCYRDPIDMGIFRTVKYTAGISTSEIIARCRAAEPG
ncbi:MAG: adenylyltransferase/cytidyltransferase family protein [Chloroflexi bacterium]|nr:adenylyltransferase/cytidyltransferase family protein [Chloroflexota bacterium]MCH8816817.1 adenylyltransferase/cytidyltransferase family protein [Chloroflexota bacterium]